MKMKSPWILFFTALAMMASTAGVLSYLKTHQKLGQPGVKVGTWPLSDPKGNRVTTNSVWLPETVGNYGSKLMPVTEAELNTLPKDTTYGKRIYQAPDGFPIQVNVVLMGTDRTSIHKPEFCVVGQGWSISGDQSKVELINMNRPVAYDLPVKKLLTTIRNKDRSGNAQMMSGVYVYWFVSADRVTANHGQRMWWMAQDLLFRGMLDRWAYIACFSPCPPGDEAKTFDRMKQFIAAAVPEFQITVGDAKAR